MTRAVIPVPQSGSQLLFREATGLEKAMADADAERLIGIYAEIIIDQWDPYEISLNNLPYLAWAMGCNLWEADYWSEGTRRDWVARQWQFQALRGSPEAYRMALGQSGYEITDMVRPPQGFYASPDLTKEEQDAWIRQMPEIRIYWADREGDSGIDEAFADIDNALMTPEGPDFDDSIIVANCGFAEQDAVPVNDGWALRGRYAIIRQRGVDTPLDLIQYEPATADFGVVDFERLSTIGQSSLGVFVDEDFSDDGRYVCFEETTPYLYTMRLDREYSHDASILSLTMLTSSLTPITPRYERDSDVGNGGDFFFSDADYCGFNYADNPDGGDHLLADQIYLLDPEVAEPMTLGISFSDYSRVGMPTFCAELQIDLKTTENYTSTFEDDYFVEEAFSVPEDDSHRERAFRAIIAAKALRDTILVTFDPRRPLEVGDYLTDASAYGDWTTQLL